MKGVYECQVIGQIEVGPGVIRTVLLGPEIARQARAGQFVNVQVARTTDPLLRRPFSVHAVYPKEGLFSLLYVLVGRGTALLREMQIGENLSVVGPLGRAFDLGESPDDEHVIVAGGCGAAPLHFLCDEICRKFGCEKVTALTGGRGKESVLCEAEFRAHGVEVGVSTDDGSYGYQGFVTELLAQHLAPSPRPSPPGEGALHPTSNSRLSTPDYRPSTRVYSCGPHAMMKEVARISREAGVSSCQVSLENNMACGIGVCMGCVQKIRGGQVGDTSGGDWHYERVCADGPVFNAEDIIWD